MSEVKTDSVVNVSGDNDSGIDLSTNDVVAIKTADTERLRVDASGNVGIGTSTVDSALHIEQDASGVTETSGSTLKIHNKNSSGRSKISVHNSAETASGSIYYDTDSGSLALQGDTGANVTIHTGGNTERMRIDTSGRLLQGVTTASGFMIDVGTNGGSGIFVQSVGSGLNAHLTRPSANHSYNAMRFDNSSASIVGTISVGTSSTSYNTTSDHRLKENVADMTGAIDRVKALAPKRFNFIVDADTTVDGFLAHEAQTVVPEAVTGTHNEVDDDGNAVMQGIDQSKLVPLLTGALKEAIAKIEALEARVTALEDA